MYIQGFRHMARSSWRYAETILLESSLGGFESMLSFQYPRRVGKRCRESMIIPFAEVYLHESIIQHIRKSTLIVIALTAHPSYLIHYRRHPISCPSTCTHIIHPTWHTYDSFIINEEGANRRPSPAPSTPEQQALHTSSPLQAASWQGI